jgi:outer membrane receptor for ferrienterochelin and colicins
MTRFPKEDRMTRLAASKAAPDPKRAPTLGLALLALVVFLGRPLPAFAQTGTTVTGTVVDSSGGPLPGAGVTLTGPGPGRFAPTGPDGHFRFTGVSQGTYRLSATLAGFLGGSVDGIVVQGAAVEVPTVTLPIAPRGEDIVVTASKVESSVVNAPVSVSVITGDDLKAAAGQNYGDVLRQVPGMNVIQMSARDINVTSRESTSTLSNSQLALLDGRSIYLDFFGLILWDYVPTNPDVIKQIEVVRGPASAVWGANALTGVVNIITKSPREMEGGSVTLMGGGFSRDASSTAVCQGIFPLNGQSQPCEPHGTSQGAGGIFGGDISYAHAPNDKVSYRVSAGYYFSDAYPRPVGTVPLALNPAYSTVMQNVPGNITGGGPYPPFPTQGTKQPKFNARVDQELNNGGRVTYEAGAAGTRGIINSGIGPFDIQSGSYMGFGRVGYAHSALKINAFGNFVDTKAPNLLQIDALTRQPLQLNFKTQTYDLEVGNSNALGEHNLVTYGGNARRNNFNITITPNGQNRNEFGAYLQDEIFYKYVRFSLGARVDKFGNLDHAVYSPRLAAIVKPTANQALRFSFNKAFRSPSLINNYLDIDTFVPVDLSGLAPLLPPPLQGLVAQPFPLIVHSAGSEVRRVANPSEAPLREESVKAYEVGYTGTFGGKTTLEAAFYINDHNDSINFITSAPIQTSQGVTGAFYTPQNPPPGWVLPPALIGLLEQQGIFLPAQFTYLNLGPYRQKGFELGLQQSFTRSLNGYANYSYQYDPEVRSVSTSCGACLEFPKEKLAFPPRNRFNAGVSYDDRRYLATASANYSAKAFWTDVLNDPFHGFTRAYTIVNASFGVKWNDGRIVTSIKAQNILNDNIQQHIFGDILKRSVYGEVRFKF